MKCYPERHQGVGTGDMGRPDGLPEQLQGPSPGRRPHPRKTAAARSTYMTVMYNIQYTLSTTHYHAPTGDWVVYGTDSLPPCRLRPPPHNPGPSTYTRMTSLTTQTSGACRSANPWTRCSPSAAETRALAGRCITLPSGPNGPARSRGPVAVEGHAAPPAVGGPP